jgi:hypothetical protein
MKIEEPWPKVVFVLKRVLKGFFIRFSILLTNIWIPRLYAMVENSPGVIQMKWLTDI